MVEFLWTSEPVAQFIILVIVGGFFLWGGAILWMSRRLTREHKILLQVTDVSPISAYSRANSPDEEAEAVFAEFLSERKVPSDSEVIRHLKSIFEAGCANGRIDSSELIEHTSNKLFQWNRPLRAILGVFIVIGLLGTLIGLSQALATFAEAGSGADITRLLQDVLADLKTALAPSIWGVLMTVLGVGAFTSHVSRSCSPLKSDLEWATLSVWMPKLYPTTAQRTVETLEEAEQQLQHNMEAARDVAEFAQKVDSELGDFDRRLERASSVLETFGDVMGRADSISERFTTAMENAAKSQERVQDVVEEAEKRSQQLQQLVSTLAEQNRSMENRLQELDRIEEERRAQQKETQESLSKILNTANDALKTLSARNDDVLKELGKPLVKELENVQAKLEHVDETMYDRLGDLKEELGRLENPVADSANQIELIADTFATNVERLVSDVQSEFYRQNEQTNSRNQELIRLNENLDQLVTNQNDLIGAIRSLNGTSKRRGYWKKFKALFRS